MKGNSESVKRIRANQRRNGSTLVITTIESIAKTTDVREMCENPETRAFSLHPPTTRTSPPAKKPKTRRRQALFACEIIKFGGPKVCARFLNKIRRPPHPRLLLAQCTTKRTAPSGCTTTNPPIVMALSCVHRRAETMAETHAITQFPPLHLPHLTSSALGLWLNGICAMNSALHLHHH